MNQKKSTNRIESNCILCVSLMIIAVCSYTVSAIEPPTMYIHDDYTFQYDWWGYVVVDSSGTSSDYIIINLNGHKIYGKGKGYGIGIKIDNKSYIHIETDINDPKDAFIEDFEYGIKITNSDNILITYRKENGEGIYIDNCDYGIYITYTDDGRFKGGWTNIDNCDYGVYTKYCDNFQVHELWIGNCLRGHYSYSDRYSDRFDYNISGGIDSDYGLKIIRNDYMEFDNIDACNNNTYGFYGSSSYRMKFYGGWDKHEFWDNGSDGFHLRYCCDYYYYNIDACYNDNDGIHLTYGSNSNDFHDCLANYNDGDNLDNRGSGNTFTDCDFTDP